MSDSEMSPIILAAMRAHNTQNFMAYEYNSTLCVSLGLSVNRYLILSA